VGLGWALLAVFVAFMSGVGVGVAWPALGLLTVLGRDEPEPEQAPVLFAGQDRRRVARRGAEGLGDLL
jgi:hypothetical protein